MILGLSGVPAQQPVRGRLSQLNFILLISVFWFLLKVLIIFVFNVEVIIKASTCKTTNWKVFVSHMHAYGILSIQCIVKQQ